MKMLKRMSAFGACALLVVSVMLGFTACFEVSNPNLDENGQPNQIETEVDYDITATLKVAYKSENSEKAIVQSLADGFKKIFKNVTVELVAYNDGTANAITKLYNAKTMPDIFMSDSFSMLTLSATKGLLLNFTPYIEQEIEAGNFALEDYYDAYMRLGQIGFNGAQCMIPRSADRVVCHINKKLIREVEEETGKDILSKIHNGWTWEEFYEVCDLLKEGSTFKKSGRFLLDGEIKWEAVWNPVFKSYGVEYFDKDGNVAIDSEATKQALDHFKYWVSQGYCASPTSGMSADFEYGKGVFYFNSMAASQEIKTLIEAYKDTDDAFTVENASNTYDVVTMPVKADNPLIGAGAAGYCGYAGSENPALVWQFMKYLLTKDGQNAIADSGVNYVPVRKDMADYTDSENNHWGKGYENINLQAYVYKSGELLGDGSYNDDWNCNTDYFNVKGSKYAVDLNAGVSTFVTSYAAGSKSYETVLNTLKKTWDAALKKR